MNNDTGGPSGPYFRFGYSPRPLYSPDEMRAIADAYQYLKKNGAAAYQSAREKAEDFIDEQDRRIKALMRPYHEFRNDESRLRRERRARESRFKEYKRIDRILDRAGRQDEEKERLATEHETSRKRISGIQRIDQTQQILTELRGKMGYYMDAAAAHQRGRLAGRVVDMAAHLRQTMGGLDEVAKKYGLPPLLLVGPLGLPFIPAMVAGAGVGLLSGKSYNYLRGIQSRLEHYQYLADYYANRLPAYYATHYARKVVGAGIRGLLETGGNGLGLTKYVADPDYTEFAPTRWLNRPWKNAPGGADENLVGQVTPHGTFRPAYAYRRWYSRQWQNLADLKWKGHIGKKHEFTIPNRGIFTKGPFKKLAGTHTYQFRFMTSDSYIRNAASKLAKKKRQSGNILPFMFIFDFFGGLIGGAITAALESSVLGMGVLKFFRGYLGPALKAIPSASAISAAYLGHNFFKSHWLLGAVETKIPVLNIPINLGGILSGGVGWHYQTCLNMARNTMTVPRYYLDPNSKWFSTYAAEQWRNDFVGGWRGAKTWDLKLQALSKVSPMPDFASVPRVGLRNPITGRINLIGAQQYELANVRVPNTAYRINNPVLNKAFNRPADFLRRYPAFRLPFRGAAIAAALNLPLNDPLTWVLVGGDWALQVMHDIPWIKGMERSVFLGAAVGGIIAQMTGGSVLHGALWGAGVGATINILKDTANLGEWIHPIDPITKVTLQAPGYLKLEQIAQNGNLIQRFMARSYIRLLTGQNYTAYMKAKLFGIPKLIPTTTRFRLFEILKGLASWGHTALSGASVGLIIATVLSAFGLHGWYTDPLIMSGIGAGASLGARLLTNWFSKIGILSKNAWARISMAFGKVMGGFAALYSGADTIGALSSAIDYLSHPQKFLSKATLDFALRTGIWGLTVLSLGALGWAGVALFFVGLVADVISRVTTGRGILDLIFRRISYRLAQAGISLPKIGANILNFFLGFLQVLFARSTDEMAQGAVMAASAFMMVGTAGTMLFVLIPAWYTPLQRQTALGTAYTQVEKSLELVDQQTLQLTFTGRYLQETDLQGNPSPDPLKIGKFTDTFSNNFSYNDIEYEVMAGLPYIPADDYSIPSIPGEDDGIPGENDILFHFKENSPLKLEMNDNYVFQLMPHTSRTIGMTLHLTRPLSEIIDVGGIPGKLCNTLEFTGRLPVASFRFSNQTVLCINSKGETVMPDDLEASLQVYKAIVAVYYPGFLKGKESWCSAVCSPDRLSDECIQCVKQNCRLNCPEDEYDEGNDWCTRCAASNNAVEDNNYKCYGKQYKCLEDAGLNPGAAKRIEKNIETSWVPCGPSVNCQRLQCVGFVMAVEAQLGRDFSASVECAKDYAQDAVAEQLEGLGDTPRDPKDLFHFERIEHKPVIDPDSPEACGWANALKPGDILVIDGSTTTECGHIAIIHSFNPSSCQIEMVDANGTNGRVSFDHSYGDTKSIAASYEKILGYYSYINP